ncbi:LexA family protein [Shewanella nanhaiensis]|uniref:Translesion error-prone DNA polymerase V autoproteolytic subunit n=1 Tax=Shewanella nanhaiensis TaxID=2864872 RepID=A0ABS7E708_9GAMM|nr:translesion error-prone DNA polymerase V autoproteolytic subunit [Shewanella nanhaiensis]MBW8185468.1 translesion error-prone DNA polymerase V autoproteolytic subunit [Shewanella nanhaiensis]
MKLITISASAGITGFESPAADYKQLELSLDELLVEHPSATFLARASGNSMQGVGIFDGDILIVDRHVTVTNQDIIVANYNGSFVCKIIDTKRKLLLSANEEHQVVTIHEYDQFSIEGVVIRSIRCHRASPLFTGGGSNLCQL